LNVKKYLLSMAALLLFSGGAHAIGQNYVLSSVVYENSFAAPVAVAACTGCGISQAADDGAGNIALHSINWYFNAGGNEYFISFEGATTLASATTLSKIPSSITTCTNLVGSVCTPTNVRSGMGPLTFYTGIASDNITTCTNNRCRVDVAIVGTDLVVAIKRALSESATSSSYQTYTLTFAQVVPLPAGVWLFGSALGLMGFARRKMA
jgi:hypothetical protein